MEIEFRAHVNRKTGSMKKSIKKLFGSSLRKTRQLKQKIARLHFSRVKEDFLFTKQEEREGGFFGSTDTSYFQFAKMN